MDRERFEQMWLIKKSHVILSAVEMVVLATMLIIVSAGSFEGAASVYSLVAGQYAPAFWGGIVLLGPVSYTHLDVYKRQSSASLPGITGSHTSAFDALRPWRGSTTYSFMPRSRATDRRGASHDGPLFAVDVYKRQDPTRVAAKSSAFPTSFQRGFHAPCRRFQRRFHACHIPIQRRSNAEAADNMRSKG